MILVNAPEKNKALVPTPAELLGLFAVVKRSPIAAYVETVSADALVSATLEPVAITATRRDTALGTTEWTLANGVHVVLKPTDFKAMALFHATSPCGLSSGPYSLCV